MKRPLGCHRSNGEAEAVDPIAVLRTTTRRSERRVSSTARLAAASAAVVLCASFANTAGASEEQAGHEAGVEATTHGAPDGAIRNWWSWDYGPGAHDPAHRQLPPPFGLALVNFAVLAGLVVAAARKPIGEFVRTRRAHVETELNAARELHARAQQQLLEYQGKLMDLEKTTGQLLAQARAEVEEERKLRLLAADAEAARLRQEATQSVEGELRRVSAQLRHEAIDAALQLATQLVERGLTADDRRRTIERFVGEIQSTSGQSASSRSPRGEA
jgi:F-type H+-transporting ATPase subunit b